ncbi:hypothetical protein PWG71_12560 [Nocardiopsis sp. N85]|uniref:hypothetical protein n=1 Tax=Nocardiopsis sp. N85 TaxID=3029400 RepID=UPI00237F320F|nr:hypothetical protein [Nocardiopsis sp. N85]MDE3722221.1 hypothetical protein [Nocardiopsis sp. N85]
MRISILCRTCLGTGTRAVVLARREADHTLTQVLLGHPCTDCDRTGHQELTATVHPDTPDTTTHT